jgi:hypothetical protein
MRKFDDLFPSPVDCYLVLFQDAVYEHDSSFQYSVHDGQFVRRNKTELADKIVAMAELVYEEFSRRDSSFSQCRPHVDYVAILTVLTRYSRDVYGCRRIKAKIETVAKIVGELKPEVTEELERIITEPADFDFKIPSENPYIERQASVLLYWFSVLKPFHLDFKKSDLPPPEDYIQSYFNEYFAYFMVCMALHAQSVDLTIHSNKEAFKEFLSQLHFRNLSRSSLEFFLPYQKRPL